MNRHRLFRVVGDRIDVTNRDVYEFGIYLGNSMVQIEEELITRGKVPAMTRYCDSFDGFPRDLSTWMPGERVHYDGDGGMFSAARKLGCLSPEDAAAKVIERCDPSIHSETVIGFYDESLERAYNDSWLPAAYVDIDVDLYCSARDVLDFMFRHKLIVPGTVIFYDDWIVGPEFEGGESQAHVEMIEKYSVTCTKIADFRRPARKNTSFKVHMAKAFVIDTVGA